MLKKLSVVNFFSAFLRCKYSPRPLAVLQPGSVLLEYLGALPLKCSDRERWGLARELICLTHRHRQQRGDGREKGGGSCVEVGKGEEMRTSVIVSAIKTKLKRVSVFLSLPEGGPLTLTGANYQRQMP